MDEKYNPVAELLELAGPDAVLSVMSSPLKWAEAFIKTPAKNAPLKANFIQHQILSSKHRFNVIRVHRRGGKTFALTLLALYYAITRESFEILIICPAASQVMNIFTTIREFIRVNDWIQPFVESNKQAPQTIRFTNGSRILGYTTGAKQKGAAMGIRGFGADILLIDEAAYLNEEDWPTIIPIMQGDEHRRGKVLVYVSSTPALTRGFYYECCEGNNTAGWHQVYVPITHNPSVSDKFREECRNLCASEGAWRTEYLAQFPEQGESVFPKSFVERSLRNFSYAENLYKAQQERKNGIVAPMRAMGVDWDKYNSDGRGPNISIVEALPNGKYRVIFREEIPQQQFSMDKGVEAVIRLNEIFDPQLIFVDHGNGEYQIETLQKYGLQNPSSGLDRKVVPVWFNESIKVPLPGGGEDKRRFKQAMIAVLQGWFEKDLLELSQTDKVLIREFIEYHVVSITESNLKFSNKNEHGIDSCGMAAMAIFYRLKNPFAPQPATRSYLVQAPMAVPSEQIRRTSKGGFDDPFGWAANVHETPVNEAVRTNIDLRSNTRNPFNRGNLGGNLPGKRSSF